MSKYNINTNVNDDVIENDIEIKSTGNEELILKKHSSKDEKPHPIQFYLPKDLIRKLDLICKQTGLKRSELATELFNYAIAKTKIVD